MRDSANTLSRLLTTLYIVSSTRTPETPPVIAVFARSVNCSIIFVCIPFRPANLPFFGSGFFSFTHGRWKPFFLGSSFSPSNSAFNLSIALEE